MGYQEIKLEWPDIPRIKLKLFFFSHLVLISWSSLGDWGTEALLVHNLLFLFCFVWSIIHHEDEDSVFLCFAIDVISILLDVIILGSRYPAFRTSRFSHTIEFSAIMCIFNLFLRLGSSWVLYWDWGDRRGLVAVTVTKNMEGGSVRSGSVLTHYPGKAGVERREDIDIFSYHKVRPSYPPSHQVTASRTKQPTNAL